MNCYTMKALTLSGDWYEFSITDIPVIYEDGRMALINKPGSPILSTDRIIRGTSEYGLFEGDVIRADGKLWVVCYERGFKIVSNDYVIRYLYNLSNFEKVGTYQDFQEVAPVTFRRKLIFKYKNAIFTINDIVGAYDGGAIIRSLPEPLSPELIQQECGMRYQGNLLFLGDFVNDSLVALRGGRITVNKSNSEYLDLATGGVLNGYIPRSNG